MNFGSITVPTKWDQITLKQFSDLMKIYDKKGDIVDIISLLSGKSKNEIRQYPTDFIDAIMGQLLFLDEPLNIKESPSIEINGKVYSINYLEKLKFGEFTDIDTIIKQDKFNYPAILAILCRLDGEIYNDDFIANKLDERIKMFEQLSISIALKVLNFFLYLGERYMIHTQKSLVLKEGKEIANQYVQAIKDSLKDGHFKKLDMIYAKIELKRLTKSLKSI